jgi:hypothetical protein
MQEGISVRNLSRLFAWALAACITASIIAPLPARARGNGEGKSARSEDRPVKVPLRAYLPDPHAQRREHKLAGTVADRSWRTESSELRDLRVTRPESSGKEEGGRFGSDRD